MNSGNRYQVTGNSKDSGFSIQDSGELFLHFSILSPQHVRHASVGWHPICLFMGLAEKTNVASLGSINVSLWEAAPCLN